MDPLGRPASGVSPGRRQGGDDSFALLLGNGRRRLVQRVNRTAPDKGDRGSWLGKVRAGLRMVWTGRVGPRCTQEENN